MTEQPPIVSCPNCHKPVSWTASSRYRPFCSERCKLADLGDWLDEKHRIGDDDQAQDFLPPQSPDVD